MSELRNVAGSLVCQWDKLMKWSDDKGSKPTPPLYNLLMAGRGIVLEGEINWLKETPKDHSSSCVQKNPVNPSPLHYQPFLIRAMEAQNDG